MTRKICGSEKKIIYERSSRSSGAQMANWTANRVALKIMEILTFGVGQILNALLCEHRRQIIIVREKTFMVAAA